MTAAYKAMTARKPLREDVLRRRIDKVPEDMLYVMACKTYAMCNLAWQYVDTIIDFCVEQRIDGTKRLVRAVRELKDRYNRFRDSNVANIIIKRDEDRNAETLEDFAAKDFSRLFYSLDAEVGKLGLNANHKMLVVAVHQALTVIDAVKLYASQCDERLKPYGITIHKYALLQKDFLLMSRLIPEFAGDCYSQIGSREGTAKILLNKVNEMGVSKRN